MGKILSDRLVQKTGVDDRIDAYLNLKLAAFFLRAKEEQAYAPFGLTVPQFNVLRILRGVHPNGHPRYEIAKRMVEPASDVTRLLDRLKKSGLIERDRSGLDRRLTHTRITPKGIALLDKLMPAKDAFIAGIDELLTPAECRTLSRLCEKIYGASK